MKRTIAAVVAPLAALGMASALALGTGMPGMASAQASASPRISNFKTYDNGTNNANYACVAGRNYYVTATPVTGYHNNCDVRVILYQHHNISSGWHYCTNPRSAGTVPARYQHPGAVRIGIHPGVTC